MTPEQIEEAAIEAAKAALKKWCSEEWWDKSPQRLVPMEVEWGAFARAAIKAYKAALWVEGEPPKGPLVEVSWLNTHGNERTTLIRFYDENTLDCEDHEIANDDGYAPSGWYEDPGERGEIYPFELPQKMWWSYPRPLPKPPEKP